MQSHIILTVFLALAAFPCSVYAQNAERKPGLYAVVGGESRNLSYNCAGAHIYRAGREGQRDINETHEVFHYKGTTSGVEASDTFVLVTDPEKWEISRTLSQYDIFIDRMTPKNMMVIPLTVNTEKRRREFDPGAMYMGVNIWTELPEKDFDWEQTGDNSYEIKVKNLTPGEYAFVFRPAAISVFDYMGIFSFTVPAL